MTNSDNESIKKLDIKNSLFFVLVFIILILSVTVIIVSSIKLDNISDNDDNIIIFTTPDITTRKTTSSTFDPFGKGPWENKTLPLTIKPLESKLTLRVYPTLNSFEGEIEITASNMEKNNKVILIHAEKPLIIEGPMVYLIKESGENIKLRIKSSFMYNENSYFVIELANELDINDQILIVLQFRRFFDSDESNGFFKRTFIDSDNINKTIMSTNFKETNAKKTFPCFEDSRFKTNLNLIIKHPENTFAISNSKVYNTTEIVTGPGPNGRIYETFFAKSYNIRTNQIRWLILPNDFGKNTVLEN